MAKRTGLVIPVAVVLGLVVLLGAASWYFPQGKSFISRAVFKLRDHQNGTVYYCQEGRLIQKRFKDGVRDGIWQIWGKDGNLVSQCEYHLGRPWNGMCFLQDGKPWVGEYNRGRPWNGFLPKNGKSVFPIGWGYYLNGREVSCAAYCKYRGLDGDGYRFYGTTYVGKVRKVSAN